MSRHDTSIIPPELLLQAYRAGIFPMSDSRDDPEVYWVEPRMRAILPLDGFHLSHSLARTLRRGRFRVTCNEAFDAVIDACAAPRETEGGGTWITPEMRAAYLALHRLGYAHSVETWHTDRLVGGFYGIWLGDVFFGESMFSMEPDASKVALSTLVRRCPELGLQLIDCQMPSRHLASLGSRSIPRADFLRLIDSAGAFRQNPRSF